MTTIAIMRPDKTRINVEVLHAAHGLAVTMPENGSYTVTHVASGMAIWPRLQRCHSAEDAARAMQAAVAWGAERGVDWREPVDVVRPQVEPIHGDLMGRMKRAAFPPRRPRWRKGVTKRRLRPYYAEVKRQALRSLIHDGLRTLLHPDDLILLRWGRDWVGDPSPPMRQPCHRFGTRCRAAAVERRKVTP